MKIVVHAKPRAREEAIEKIEDGRYVVAVREPPVQGKANEAIARALARYFRVAPSCVRLLAGFSAKEKVFDVAIECHRQ